MRKSKPSADARRDARLLAGRFTGVNGTAHLADAIAKQTIVAGDPKLVKAISSLAPRSRPLRGYARGADLIEADARDRSLHLILAGKVEIWVRGNLVAERVAGEHVGEMACIDATAPRSARVTATESTVTIALHHTAFDALAIRHPMIWKRIACTLGARLRERGARERMANAKPHVFIGSSGEQLDTVERIRSCLNSPRRIVNAWHRVFDAGDYTLEKLSELAFRADFAILLLTPDDVTTSRKSRKKAPRDNVVLELGLFVGRLGVKRVFVVDEAGPSPLRLPSDLDGITRLPFKRNADAREERSLESVSRKIGDAITERGVRFAGRDGR